MDMTKRVLELIDEITANVQDCIDVAIKESGSSDSKAIIAGVTMAFAGQIAGLRALVEHLYSLQQEDGEQQ